MSKLDHTEDIELGEVGRILMEFSIEIPWMDEDFAILVLDEISRPFIVMDINTYAELEKRILGNGRLL